MKSLVLALILLTVTAGLFAQANPPQTPAQPAPPPQAGPMHHPPHHPGRMAAMHQKHMEAMKAELAKMHAKLDEMKANLAKVKDPAAKQQIQLDADLWEIVVGHMEQMQKMMSDHPGMGPG